MEASGCGVVRIRAVTIRKKGDEEEGSSVGEDVLSARTSSTVAFADLFAMVKSASRTGHFRQTRTDGKDVHLLHRSFCQS